MNDVEQMTDEQLNKWVHEKVMGECWHESMPDNTDPQEWDPSCIKCGKDPSEITSEDFPKYATDLNLAAKAEAVVIERGHGEEYLGKLGMLLDFGKWSEDMPLGLYYATATARQRCDAMYSAMESRSNT